MKQVIISIKGEQYSPETGPDSIEFVTSGSYEYAGEESTLTYMESNLHGMEGTRTIFRVGPELITLTREGTVRSQMIFQEGRRCCFLYDTPYGNTAMGVDTRKIRGGFHENGGEMEISYVLDVDNRVVSKNKFSIQFEPVKAAGELKQ